MDPATGMIASTIIGGLFGRSRSASSEPNKYYKKAFDAAFKNYLSTNYEEIDKEAMAEIMRTSQSFGMNLLGNYDAVAASAGSPLWKSDTQKDSARTEISRSVAQDVAQQRAQLLLSRPQRRLALIPGLNQPAYTGAVNPPSNNIGALSNIANALFSGGGGGGNPIDTTGSTGRGGGGGGGVYGAIAAAIRGYDQYGNPIYNTM